MAFAAHGKPRWPELILTRRRIDAETVVCLVISDRVIALESRPLLVALV
jgi:hypothetical protein